MGMDAWRSFYINKTDSLKREKKIHIQNSPSESA